MWTAVVLPAPLGPRSEDRALGDLEVDAVENDLLAERLVQAPDLDGGGRPCLRCHRAPPGWMAGGRPASDVELLHGRLPRGARDHVEQLGWDLVAQLVEVGTTSRTDSLGEPP